MQTPVKAVGERRTDSSFERMSSFFWCARRAARRLISFRLAFRSSSVISSPFRGLPRLLVGEPISVGLSLGEFDTAEPGEPIKGGPGAVPVSRLSSWLPSARCGGHPGATATGACVMSIESSGGTWPGRGTSIGADIDPCMRKQKSTRSRMPAAVVGFCRHVRTWPPKLRLDERAHAGSAEGKSTDGAKSTRSIDLRHCP